MSRGVSGPIGVALLAVVASGAVAYAQDAPAPSAAPAPAATDAPAPAASGSAAAPAGSGSAASPSTKTGGLTGYAYGGAKALPPPTAGGSGPRHHLLHHHADEAVAKFTGFEMLADGGSRLFVQLTKQVEVEPEKADAPAGRKGKKGHGGGEPSVVSRLKFVLKGAEIVNTLFEESLITTHFNTPVVRARLVPEGKNLDLVVELRADVTPEVKFVAAKDNGSILQVDFPQGSYLPADAQTPDANGNAPSPAAAPSAGASDKAGSN